MSVNRFDTKLWLLLNINRFDFVVELKENMFKYLLNLFRFSGSVVYGKQLRQIYDHDIYSYICYFSKFDCTSLRECILVEILHESYYFISL